MQFIIHVNSLGLTELILRSIKSDNGEKGRRVVVQGQPPGLESNFKWQLLLRRCGGILTF